MAINIPWELFQKLVTGDLQDAEQLQLEQWRQQADLNNLIYEEIVNDQNFCDLLQTGSWKDNSREWENILDRINPKVYKTVKLTPRNYWLSAAVAGLLLLMGLTGGLFFTGKQPSGTENTFTHIYSPRGQRTQVTLPDKSRVWLNSETSMQYPSTFNGKIREVTIEGEAFFEVAKNPEKPFIVNTSELKVKVYGTSFNVKAYPDEKTIETTLIDGKLSIQPNSDVEGSKELFLKPNEKVTYTKPTGTTNMSQEKVVDKTEKVATGSMKQIKPVIKLISNVNVQPESSWKSGKLYFNDETFGELAVKLERWFDVQIHFESEEVKNYRFTGVFDKETIGQAMEALRLSSQESYYFSMKFRDVYIRKQK